MAAHDYERSLEAGRDTAGGHSARTPGTISYRAQRFSAERGFTQVLDDLGELLKNSTFPV